MAIENVLISINFVSHSHYFLVY